MFLYPNGNLVSKMIRNSAVVSSNDRTNHVCWLSEDCNGFGLNRFTYIYLFIYIPSVRCPSLIRDEHSYRVEIPVVSLDVKFMVTNTEVVVPPESDTTHGSVMLYLTCKLFVTQDWRPS